MGRTVKTATMLIESEAMRWSQFRKSLRKTDKDAFDRLIALSKRHFSAISNSSIVDPFEAVVLSILLEFERRIEVVEGEWNPLGCPPGGYEHRPLDKVG